MLKKIIPLFILTIICNAATSQQIGNYLSKKIQEANGKKIPVIVILNEQWNSDSALAIAKKQRLSAAIRIRSTVSSVKNFTRNHQKNLLSDLENAKKTSKISEIYPFWAANIIALKASGEAIYQIARHPDVYEIVYDEPAYAIYPNEHTNTKEKKNSKAQALKGLKAINAHKLWQVGYTGKGCLAFNIDTGVFPEHPVFGNRFMGNYFPLSQTWLGFNNNWPFDISLHGTHTLGTILGFETSYKDTIGVAFEARFIASDPIVSNLNEVRPRSELMKSFQWSLDPDGDVNTVYDVPDVINNSWGITNTNNPENCNLPSTLILNTVNAAGIAVVFSAGNNGPNASTISEPVHIARSTTNVFSVGAVDATNLQIANWSSRGPTNCYSGSDLSLLIKPEVSAPGVNIYSCTGTDSYEIMSGTSMAAPHVSGAVLLLKEAFPDASGEDILLALYNTAKDLGDPGEDNSYGKGFIDCEAAFISLSKNYSIHQPILNPVDPFVKISNRNYIGPKNSYEVLLEMHCKENKPFSIVSCDLNSKGFQINHSFTTEKKENYILINIAIDPQNLPDEDKHLIKGIIQTDSETDDLTDNNFWFYIYHPTVHKIPYFVTFENTEYDFGNSNIMVYNPDNYIGWRVDTIAGINNNRYAAKMNFYKYIKMQKEKDYLILPLIDVSGYEKLNFSFKYAYAKRLANYYKDSLLIIAHYGDQFEDTDTLFSNSGETLSTLPNEMSSSQFVPSTKEHWKDTTISINHLTSHNILKFEIIAINDNGNNLYIDNIAVHENENPLLVIENPTKKIIANIYPNPINDVLTIESSENINDILIFDISGRIIKHLKSDNNRKRTTINTAHFPFGIYTIKIQTKRGIISKKIIKH